MPELDRRPEDIVVEKTLNDPFVDTGLQAILQRIPADRLIVAGWAADFCVDSTVRSAVSRNYNVVVVSDGHTLDDRPHLDAPAVIGHHNWVWSNLIARRSIRVVSTAQLIAERVLLAKATS